MNATIIIAGNYHLTPFDLFSQDADEVIMLLNYLSEAGGKEKEQENKPVSSNDGFWDF
jgi:hypothetical protein